STNLAHHGVACLFVQMAYYGPRREGSGLKLLTYDLAHTSRAIQQTVLDLRVAAAWLESRPEVDARRPGMMGTSLGSFLGTLAAEMEPRYKRLGVLLGGGGIVDAFWEHPLAVPLRTVYEKLGGKKETIARLIAPLDPITHAAVLKDRKVLIL